MTLHANMKRVAAMSIDRPILNPELDLIPRCHLAVGMFPRLIFNIAACSFLELRGGRSRVKIAGSWQSRKTEISVAECQQTVC
jgi:hypothetical protein